MPYFARPVAAAAVLGLIIGGTTVAVATPADPCSKAFSAPMDSTAKLYAYTACRDDRQDAALARIEKQLSTARVRARPATPGRSSAPAPTKAATPTPTSSPPSWRDAGVARGVALRRVPQDVSSGPGWKSDANGNVTATSGTAVLSGLLIPGRVELHRVVIKNVKVQCIGENDWCLSVAPGSTVTNVEIGGQANGKTYGHAVGMWTGGSDTAANVIDRVLIHHQISGIRLDGGTTVVNSYVRDLPMGDPVLNSRTGATRTDDHSGGIMATTNGNVVVRGTRIEGGNTANLFVQHDVTDNAAPAIHNWLIEGCEFVNGAKNGQVSSFGVRVENKPGTPGPFTVRNNTFSRGWEVAPVLSDVARTTVTGNVYTDGSPVT